MPIVAFTSTGNHTFSVPDYVDKVNVLVVAGGGGGGSDRGGGGGAGGLIYETDYVTVPLTDIAVVVGGGGQGRNANAKGDTGQNSSFDSIVALGGGGGGSYNSSAGASGGSGGGGCGRGGSAGAGGVGTAGQGFNGGAGSSSGGHYGAGGGGGSSSNGTNGSGSGGGNGGYGTDLTALFGTSFGASGWFAGGGGGGCNSSGGNGQQGHSGGGNGYSGGGNGSHALSNTGSGGGGAGYGSTRVGGNGGSGIVIVSYSEPPDAIISVPLADSITLQAFVPEINAIINVILSPEITSANISAFAPEIIVAKNMYIETPIGTTTINAIVPLVNHTEMWLQPYKLIGSKEITAVKMIPRVNMLEEEPLLFWAYIRDGNLYVAFSEWKMYNRREEIANFGPAQDCAIAFNGYWDRDPVSKRFFFISEEYPWAFRVNEGELSVRRTDADPLTLATDVTKIDAVRGWFPVKEGFEADQGLVVAYIKSGDIYYRNYCEQSNGVSYLWEEERLVAELNHGDYTDIALFRTNDFRVGFIAQRENGEIWYVVTIRNYAGMSIFPEILETTATAIFAFNEIERLEAFSAETLEITATLPMASYCAVSDLDIDLLESAVRQDDGNEILLTFAYPLHEHVGFESNFSVSGTAQVTDTRQGENSSQLVLELDIPLAQTADYVLTYTMYPDYLILAVNSNCNPPMEEFDIDLLGIPVEFEETLNVTATADFTLTEIDFEQGYESETLDVTATAEFVLRDLNGDPV